MKKLLIVITIIAAASVLSAVMQRVLSEQARTSRK